MATIRALTRDQLARFLGNNQEAIRYFEQLTSQASSDADQIVILLRISQEIAIEASNAVAAANNALAGIAAIAAEMGLAIEAPAVEQLQIPDDLTPPIQIGTLAYQNADSVEVGRITATGDIDAVNFTASADVGAVNVNASGDVNADNVVATSNVEAGTYSVNGNAGASGTGTTITAITVENGIVTAITVT